MPRSDARVFLGMPGYGANSAAAGRAFWRSTQLPEGQICLRYEEGSLLANNFNRIWCHALTAAARGQRIDYFAMIHADVEPPDGWLDVLIDELEANDLDVLGVVLPIKDLRGVTSCALARADGSTWRVHCRLTQTEIHQLPETFTSADVGLPLLLNTGLWVCKFSMDWAPKLHFTINDRIVFHPDENLYFPEVEPEDWYFSRLCHELGLKLGATRKLDVGHRGEFVFRNSLIWGEPFDSAYVSESVLTHMENE